MIFDELSKALFGFSLPLLGAELQGGLNPPPSGRGKSRGPSGGGLTKQNKLSYTDRLPYWSEMEPTLMVDR